MSSKTTFETTFIYLAIQILGVQKSSPKINRNNLANDQIWFNTSVLSLPVYQKK